MNLKDFTDLSQTKESIIDKLEYLRKDGLNDFIKFATLEMGLKKLPTKKQDQIIEQIISKSPNDLNKKESSAEFYKGHLSCLKIVLEEMFLNEAFIKNLKSYEVEKGKDLVVYNYFNLLREILFDMALLIQDYNFIIKNVEPTGFKIGKNLYQHHFTLYQLIPQIIFGQTSFHSYIEREPFVSIAIIRQIIELKIRKTFGIMGVYDNIKGTYEPFALGQIFDAIKKQEANIHFSIPLGNIIRINGWANIFMHSGMKDYIWTPIFVYRYLHNFIKGQTESIRLKQEILDKIINDIEMTLKSTNPSLELYKSKPDAYIIL